MRKSRLKWFNTMCNKDQLMYQWEREIWFNLKEWKGLEKGLSSEGYDKQNIIGNMVAR